MQSISMEKVSAYLNLKHANHLAICSSSDSNSLISVGTALANEATEIFDFVKRTIEQNRDEFNQMEQ